MNFSLLLNLVTTFAILAGVIFAGAQLKQLKKRRERESALQMLNSFQTHDFMTAYHIIFNIPDGLSKKEIEDYAGDKIVSILVLMGTFESLGILVYHDEVSLDLVDDFFSGVIVLGWKKLKKYILATREQNQRETFAEWFQWLAEQFEKRESATPPVPAYKAFHDWIA
jgi:hypothetical protein